ncbi:MAG: hypothetical protein QXU30_05965 [Sulfolobales archaeon]
MSKVSAIAKRMAAVPAPATNVIQVGVSTAGGTASSEGVRVSGGNLDTLGFDIFRTATTQLLSG